MLLTIIVPIYNTSNYLEKCVLSLLNQNIHDYEILLIDDGSTDSSLEICKKLCDQYSDKIRYFHKDNSGLSDTRNYGIQCAKGEYLLFVDSDDYIEENVLLKLEKIIQTNNRPDIVYFGYFWETTNKMIPKFSYSISQIGLQSNINFLYSELSRGNLPIPVCFALFKRSLILNNNLFFASGILHEDERWSPQIIVQSKIIYVTDIVLYHYVQRKGSITKANDRTLNGLHLLNTCYFLEEYTNSLDDKKLKKLLKNRIAMVYMRATTIGKLYRKEYKHKLERGFPLKNACLFRDKMKALLYFSNIHFYCLLNDGVRKRKNKL